MQAYSVGFSPNPAIASEAVSFVLNPRNALPQIINQDVPTYFYAVQRSRLPVIAMLLDRGLSDTNMGEVNQIYCIKFLKYFARFLHVFLPRLTALVGKLSSTHSQFISSLVLTD